MSREKPRFKKGQSGNPSGRPKMPISLTQILKQRLTEHPEDGREIVDALIAMAKSRGIQGIQAVKELFDRIDGKVIERHRIDGELPIRLVFVPAETMLSLPETRVETIDQTQEFLSLEEPGD